MVPGIFRRDTSKAADAWKGHQKVAHRESGPSLGQITRMALVAVTIQALVLGLDSQPRFLLGDSESYLGTALHRWIPPDRSWLYGLAINGILRVTHHFVALLALQAALSAALSVCTAALLRTLGARQWLAWAALLVLSLDPLLHYYDRSVLTDAPGTALLWLGIAATTAALCHDTWRCWVLATPCLLAAISLRTSFMPLIVVVVAFGLTVRAGQVFAAWRRNVSVSWRVRLRPLCGPTWLALTMTLGLSVYAAVTGRLVGTRSTVNPRSGQTLIGVAAPLLAPVDFRGLSVSDPATLLLETNHQEFALRNWQIWGRQGLVARLEKENGNWRPVSEMGGVLFRRSLIRDPLGFARLALSSAQGYLTFNRDHKILKEDLGLSRNLPDNMVASLRAKVRDKIDPQMTTRPSLLLAALHMLSGLLPLLPWLVLLLPVLVHLAPGRRTPESRLVVPLLWACAWSHFAFLSAFSVFCAWRYLLPMTPLLVTLTGLWAEGWLRRFGEAPTKAMAPEPA
jgi:hypothetical protein